MASPTLQELRDAIALLTERLGYGKVHERLVRLNAFVSRRKPPTPAALADRLYNLTGGLRRQVPATLAFHTLWAEVFAPDIGEEGEKKLEALAERVNAALTPDERAIRDGREAELDAALGEYEQMLVASIGLEAARLDMLFKAVPPVAGRLRARAPTQPEALEAKPAQPADATTPAVEPTPSEPTRAKESRSATRREETS